jgi:N-acetylmuramoyl-L-alanine amidase CwlA
MNDMTLTQQGGGCVHGFGTSRNWEEHSMQFITHPLDVGQGADGYSCPGTPFTPSGVVLRSTDTLNATAVDERSYFNNHEYFRINQSKLASAHRFVDWSQAITTIPWQPGKAEIAWHAGPVANHRYLGIEWCETDDHDLFAQGNDNFVRTMRTILDWYQWPVDDQHVYSHAQISAMFGVCASGSCRNIFEGQP